MDEHFSGYDLETSWQELLSRKDSLVALENYIPSVSIQRVLEETGCESQRERRLVAPAVVWLVIGIGLWGRLNMKSVWRQVLGIFKALLMAGANVRLPVRSSYSQARQRLGARPMAQLYRSVAKPVATEKTLDAFYKGLRKFSIDGLTFDVPDTPPNAKAFGRPSTKRNGEEILGGFPQVHLTLLEELGTHVTCGVVIKQAKASEVPCAHYLKQKIPEQSLTMMDKLFYSYELIRWFGESEGNRHLLLRLASNVSPTLIKALPDGSYLAEVRPSWRYQGDDKTPVLVRVIEYTLDDPDRPGHGEKHRLLTTLLDHEQHPALELIALYHDRWEIEIGNDEVKTHQLERDVHLRSKTPAGVIQEVYGILLAYNAVRFHIFQAAEKQGVAPTRISFTHAVRVIRDAMPILKITPKPLIPLFQELLAAHISQEVLPPRDNRSNPRVVKKRTSKFPKKKPEDYQAPQPQKKFIESVVILK